MKELELKYKKTKWTFSTYNEAEGLVRKIMIRIYQINEARLAPSPTIWGGEATVMALNHFVGYNTRTICGRGTTNNRFWLVMFMYILLKIDIPFHLKFLRKMYYFVFAFQQKVFHIR